MEHSRREPREKSQRQRLGLSTETAADNERRRISRVAASPSFPWLALVLLIAIHSCCLATAHARPRLPFAEVSRTQHTLSRKFTSSILSIARGGATLADEEDEDEDDKEEDEEEENTDEKTEQDPEYAKLQAYRMKQQSLLQLRGIVLSEILAARGLPIPSLESVSTPAGAAPPQKVDWDCAFSTKENKLRCMYTFDDEYGTKFIAPIDPKRGEPLEDEWITVAALNRLRRNDRSKVLKMWHDKYAILDSWFSSDSEYSVLQHVGPKGILLNFLLDDFVLTVAVAMGILFSTIILMPLLEMMVIRFLVSGPLWFKWVSWARFAHMGLPFKLMVGSWLLRTMLKGFGYVKGKVKDHLVEIECENMAELVPLTLGVPTPAYVDEAEAEILDEEEEIMEHLVEEESDEDESEEESDDED